MNSQDWVGFALNALTALVCGVASFYVTREIRYGLQDRVTQALFPILAPLLPSRYHQIRVEGLGRAMRVNAERPGQPGTEILEYGQFIQLLRAS